MIHNLIALKYNPNDAVALNESSLSLPGMNESLKMTGSNHMQTDRLLTDEGSLTRGSAVIDLIQNIEIGMRNDENLKGVLLGLYEGDIMGYFKTLPRN